MAPVWPDCGKTGGISADGRSADGGVWLGAGVIVALLINVCTSSGTHMDYCGVCGDDHDPRGVDRGEDRRAHPGAGLCEPNGAAGSGDGDVLLWWDSVHGSAVSAPVCSRDVRRAQAAFGQMAWCVGAVFFQSEMDDSSDTSRWKACTRCVS